MVVAAVEEGIRNGWIEETEDLAKNLQAFLSDFGRAFYKVQRPESNGQHHERIILERRGERIPEVVANAEESVRVVPFKSGDEILSLRWV